MGIPYIFFFMQCQCRMARLRLEVPIHLKRLSYTRGRTGITDISQAKDGLGQLVVVPQLLIELLYIRFVDIKAFDFDMPNGGGVQMSDAAVAQNVQLMIPAIDVYVVDMK